MKIINTPEISAFLSRCWNNLYKDSQNSFLDRRVTEKNETAVKKKLQAAGQQEFNGPIERWPHLLIDANEWENSPYHQSVHLNHISSHSITYEEETILGGRLFNLEAIQPDRNRELADWMKLRALSRDTKAVYLLQNGEDWMLDAPGEAATNNPPAMAANGSVLTFGLGIGYFLFMAAKNPKVHSITVIERDPDVIALFEKDIFPQMKDSIAVPVSIVRGDAFDYWNETYLSSFDFVYTDIWRSSDDGLEIMTHLLEQYNPTVESWFWIEDSIIEPVRTAIFLHFVELAEHRTIQPASAYALYTKKVRNYFRTRNETIDSVNALKDLLYDRTIMRKILAQH